MSPHRVPTSSRPAAELGVDRDALARFVDARGPLAVVDLETTGLSQDPQAEILEFGVVLLDPGREELTTLQSLVRPSRPLPAPIQRLTGLADADVIGAPTLSELAADVAAALLGRTLIAHNADFERDFLRRFVHPELGQARYLDTQDLLALTHPDAPDLRLESFTRMLLSSEEQHRALEDALDTLRVLSRVAVGARDGAPRYITARRALERYAPESAWLPLLDASFAALAGVEPELARRHLVAIEGSDESPVPFDEAAIADVLADRERGARYFPSFRVRAEQIELARHFVRTLADGGTLLIEGGTGVGKSLAYLAAAIPFAMERAAGGLREPVVISTRTKLLQDQLLEKDIAATARFLGYPELKAMSIKGRANYACQRRFEAVLAEGRELSIFEEDRLAYAVLMACVTTRPHGEVGALPAALHRRYPGLRDLVRRSTAARAEHCSREDCAHFKRCPFGQRRAALTQAELVVANHDLLLRWPPDYPPFTHAITDEGHELAGVADEVYAQVVRPEAIIERIDEIFGRPVDRGQGDGLLPPRLRRRAEKDARAWRRALYQDLAAIGHLMGERASEYGEYQLPENAERIFPEARELAEVAAGRIAQVAELARSLDAEIPREEDEGPSSVQRAAEDLEDQAAALRLAFGADQSESVAGFSGLLTPFDRWTLAIRKVSPAGDFHSEFLDRLESFSVVSASLFVGEDAFAALGDLEIEERARDGVTRVRVGSPFDYAQHMRVAALDGRGDVVEQTAEVILDLARRLGGRTLGLFTSLRRMNQVAELIAAPLREEGLDLLTPRRASDDPGALVQRFERSGGGGVLLGARTFWQGLDIPGEALQAVVIEKLPFEVPTELRKRREARLRALGDDPFTRASLGRMLLNLKQMSGRLIRSERDRGLVVIVEGRTDRRYFRRLADAMPPGTSIQVTTRDKLHVLLEELGLGIAARGALTSSDSGS